MPLLVVAAVVGPLDDVAAVGGGRVEHGEGLVAVARKEFDVPAGGVDDRPLLVVAVVVGPLDHIAAVGGGDPAHVGVLAAVARPQLVEPARCRDELPLLVGGVGVAGPLHDVGIVGCRAVQDVQSLAAVAVDQLVPGGGVDDGRVRCGAGPIRARVSAAVSAAASALTLMDSTSLIGMDAKQTITGGYPTRPTSAYFYVLSFPGRWDLRLVDAEFRLLGDVELRAGDRVVDLGHARQRCVLAVLLIEANRLVPADQLLDRVWADRPPRRARNALSGYLSRLRPLLAPLDIAIEHSAGGYVLTIDPSIVDVHLFHELAGEGRAAADEALLERALGLWRGEAFGCL